MSPVVTMYVDRCDTTDPQVELLGLKDGDTAQIESRVGSVTAPVEVTGRIRQGVVSLPHGWGHGRSGTRLGCSADHPGASANDLTDDLVVDPTCGNAVLNGVPVRIERRSED